MKILVTGANGNLGKHFIQKCPYPTISVNRDDWQNIDELLQGVDVVLHLAYDLKSQVSITPAKIIESNVLTTGKLLEAMGRQGVRRLMYLSSCAVYGNSVITQEEQECCPISINGIAKHLNEKIITAYCSQNNIKCEIYRVFNQYGGDDHFSIISHIKRAIEQDQPFRLNNSGISQRDFVHVEDVAAILVRLLDIEHSYTFVNIGTGQAVSIRSIIEEVLQWRPQLRLIEGSSLEAEYSRADITRMKSLFDYSFVDIRSFLYREFR